MQGAKTYTPAPSSTWHSCICFGHSGCVLTWDRRPRRCGRCTLQAAPRPRAFCRFLMDIWLCGPQFRSQDPHMAATAQRAPLVHYGLLSGIYSQQGHTNATDVHNAFSPLQRPADTWFFSLCRRRRATFNDQRSTLESGFPLLALSLRFPLLSLSRIPSLSYHRIHTYLHRAAPAGFSLISTPSFYPPSRCRTPI